MFLSFKQTLMSFLSRYEREHNLAERSSIKRIQEHDSSSTRPMVLCVSGIISNNIIELTDGWYPIHAQIDESLSRALSRRKIKLGCKISIIGARVGKSISFIVNSQMVIVIERLRRYRCTGRCWYL